MLATFLKYRFTLDAVFSSTATFQLHRRLSASGETHSFLSVASHRKSSPSSPHTFLTRSYFPQVQCAALWSRLDLTTERSNLFVKMLLERARWSTLDIRFARLERAETLALLSPHAQQFRTIDFVSGYWSDIWRFSEAASGPLPLLHTLKIRETGRRASETIKPPSPPSFSGAVNLRSFFFRSEGVPLSNHHCQTRGRTQG